MSVRISNCECKVASQFDSASYGCILCTLIRVCDSEYELRLQLTTPTDSEHHPSLSVHDGHIDGQMRSPSRGEAQVDTKERRKFPSSSPPSRGRGGHIALSLSLSCTAPQWTARVCAWTCKTEAILIEWVSFSLSCTPTSHSCCDTSAFVTRWCVVITTIDAGGASYLSSHSNEGKNGENDQSNEAPIENTSECDSGFALQAIPSPARPRSPIEVGKICRAT